MNSPFAPPNIFIDIDPPIDGPASGPNLSEHTETQFFDALTPNALSVVGIGVPGEDAMVDSKTNQSLPPPQTSDLAHRIPGLYRILDLVSEAGSGGLVDKVIIAQESLGQFVNSLVPGAYTSLTKVDFGLLDKASVKPIGIYGSKAEIVKFLKSLDIVDDELAAALLLPQGNPAGINSPHLPPGLYVVSSNMSTVTKEERIFVIFWPEETTWNDDALSSVRRNRVTFMRYLTKIADQVVSLISPEHSQSLVLQDDTEDSVSLGVDDDETDRLFTFEVEKSTEQEEGVSSKPGFTLQLPAVSGDNRLPDDHPMDERQFEPRLVFSDTKQAIVDVMYLAASEKAYRIDGKLRAVQLEHEVRGSIELADSLSEEAIRILVNHGLKSRQPELCGKWRSRVDEIEQTHRRILQEKEAEMGRRLDSENDQLEALVRHTLIDSVAKSFHCFTYHDIDPTLAEPPRLQGGVQDLVVLYPQAGDHLQQAIQDRDFKILSRKRFQQLKERLIILDHIFRTRKDLEATARRELIELIYRDGEFSKASQLLAQSSGEQPRRFWSAQRFLDWFTGSNSIDGLDIRDFAFNADDAKFLNGVDNLVQIEPLLDEPVSQVKELGLESLQETINKKTTSTRHRIRSVQESECKRHIQRETESEKESQLRHARAELLNALKGKLLQPNSPSYLVLEDMKIISASNRWNPDAYQMIGNRVVQSQPALQYVVHPIELTEMDRHNLQLDPDIVPTPKAHANSAFSFCLSPDQTIQLFYILEDGKCLLVIDDQRGSISVFLESSNSIDGALRRPEKAKKTLRRDKLGKHFLLAFDETRRILAVCSTPKPNLQLHVFAFDETYTSLQGIGSAVNLVPWYEGSNAILGMAFVSGNEEIVFVDDSARARIFSLVTQQFRPASLQLQRVPSSIFASPDGSCLIVMEKDELGHSFKAYHWTNFGSADGISLDMFGMDADSFALTSLVKRNNVYILSLDISSRRCDSVALRITRKITEFSFRQKGGAKGSGGNEAGTAHNSLVDCHAEVWTRFPVVPAVRRRTILSSSGRSRRHIRFVTHHYHSSFKPYFSRLIATFEKTTRKPVETELSGILADAVAFEDCWNVQPPIVSCFKAGEWLVDILCLIPIHIAVTRDNRFVPLKDGVFSSGLERSLLGADVGQIVDHLSFGWYESVFRSYMASKPVKVVSSMGEQSVGKSFALNHLVDTSFAGSAMRTTEGVWMSVAPTEDCLIVALDFEGVHSIERSAQEDMLLVLFNTAISNLVLFRNNFALSRDIAGLFQSFQSSSSVLDPASNPTLFQSTLAIIIKDVVDSDATEITREFSLKFNDIVQLEQGSNFISRLHRGSLHIIPWPVIESRKFYTLFSALKKCLDKERVTHPSGGVFLQTLKTLMAKLKANDWGALSQNLASHRAHHLRSLLPKALAFGATEMDPEREQLKDFDTDMPIDHNDGGMVFFVPNTNSEPDWTVDKALPCLRAPWQIQNERHIRPDSEWVHDLSAYLDSLADQRLEYVRTWISCNTARFTTTNADVEALRRELESMAVDLKSGVKLCSMQCASCSLQCLNNRHHDGPHDCDTSHNCPRTCQFSDQHGSDEPCGLRAGHPGDHICDIATHHCGQPCHLKDRPGCLGHCVKVLNHAEENHLCSATTHECGEPCSLVDVQVANGRVYTCAGTCRIPSHLAHDRHICENPSCPIQCQLCRRLCDSQDHLHPLGPGAVHLCGQEHSCTALCASPGICQIETAPQSIEATFSGRNETFQYTKYTQASKRLPCAVLVPAGELSHDGPHNHSLTSDPFHYCENTCENCGYFCTLPLGHPQQEHETSHGSMSKTRWVVDGPDGTTYELDGRNFSSTDDGAPMLCSLVCQSMGRHVHIDYCRKDPLSPTCTGAETQHITARMMPNPERPKDWISHKLFWRRTGFKGQDSRAIYDSFKYSCDSSLQTLTRRKTKPTLPNDPEHSANANAAAQPSYCSLPVFHPPQRLDQAPAGLGYVSNDGHSFLCRNPAVMKQAFHVIFVIDRSGSMSLTDRRPLGNTPGTARITNRANNRLGSVYSSLHGFWLARHAALNVGGNVAQAARRDAYTVLLFNSAVSTCIENDYTRSPDQLLDAVLPSAASGGTNFTSALQCARSCMERNWSTERTPVIIFLSDGECHVEDTVVQDLCRRAIHLGKSLSFHAVSFGPRSEVLRRMAQIATDIQRGAPPDPINPPVISSYTEALDTIRLAETFLGLAESLRKPRGSLLRG
ncbi:hypothetical protein JAAARDRAFT_201615 [Jaapia argillacea MUCL 33604]|uniref:VWFA domain-containing protein n=1 Tax=Jaapia argillacea MUCL 33604 TaxID=933084 RepID=A0A067QB01_9AGAM|nr:hypothetical protein JAAARDRAFT_201615 [Jaapia argillacea MUCL 33604]